jgi:putative nucleotidyltransferase with HDIG domain
MKANSRQKIPTAELRIGMYVDELCGSWMEHPFWRTRFLIESPEQLAQIRGSGITELWIDTAKGLHPRQETVSSTDERSVDAQVDERLDSAGGNAERRPSAESVQSELKRAVKILRESRKVVADMFTSARMGTLRDTESTAQVVHSLADSVARQPSALFGLIRLRHADDYTYMHSVAASALMVALARTLGWEEEWVVQAGMAGLLHDVGKAQIPSEILNKPGSLNDQEWCAMRTHPERGLAIVQSAYGATSTMLDAILHHHEKIDGSGYPHRLKQDDIATLAKMVAVCDVYDAITSDRPYKAAWQPSHAIRKMAEWTGHFDDQIFKAFVKTIGIYPVGSLVRLSSQRLAVVVEHHPTHLSQPTVKAFFSLRSNVHIEPVLLRIGPEHGRERIIGCEEPSALGLKHLDHLWLEAGSSAIGY